MGINRASAYSDLARFDASIAEGGSDGVYFTGSPADRYTCAHCHRGAEAPRVTVSGFPTDGYRSGESYPIQVRWEPRSALTGVALEIAGTGGGALGSVSSTPIAGCELVETPAGVREIVQLRGCVTDTLELEWTAPTDSRETAWLYLSMVVTQRAMLDVEDDGVASLRQASAPAGLPDPEAGHLVASCSTLPGVRGTAGGALLLVALLMGLLLLRARRRSLSPSPSSSSPLLLLTLLLPLALLLLRRGYADDVVAGVFVRGDSDGTTVVTPTARGRFSLFDDQTHLDLRYAADIWTSASIDIRTAATGVVEEQRDEVNIGVDRDIEDVTLRAGYRFSTENDYDSHGGNLGVRIDLADNNSTLDGQVGASYDLIGRSGDPSFQRELISLNGRLSYTQVLDTETLMQVSYEYRRAEGYQASPYRFVSVDDSRTSPICGPTTLRCLEENHPALRNRQAFVVRGRRALNEDISLGISYRFYFDDWGVVANTAMATLNAMPDAESLLTAQYRLHQQSGASFYRARYPTNVPLVYVSRDKELSPMWTHRLSLAYERTVHPLESGPALRISGMIGGTVLLYDDFVGLREVWAGDLTLNLAVDL